MHYLKNRKWWVYSGTRMIKTAVQTTIAFMSIEALFADVNWLEIISAAGFAAMLSLLTSLAGLPEVDDPAKK